MEATTRNPTSKIEKNSGRSANLTNAGKGRPKGALNKVTQSAKDAIAEAAQTLGGTERLVKWIKEDPSNEKVFWGTIYPKLLPLQLSGDSDNPIQTVSRVELVALSK
jgi:hypothetical protein